MKTAVKTARKKPKSKKTLTVVPHKEPRVWIAVADNRILRIFEKKGKRLTLSEEVKPHGHRKKILADSAVGRVSSSSRSGPRHKLEPHLNKAHKEQKAFAQDIATFLDGAVRAEAFDRLIIAAAPKTLGEIRQTLSRKVNARVIAEVSKDLTKMNGTALRAELEKKDLLPEV